ncbi:helix-turn-helix domain-containing protein [Streptomyces sp. MST-110588]|uniref:winged helix-turn-helix transcriptional regulator n=1 Tax=Streptomyces sp. MST-110588 TaxID=2833628 RepID=UPI001F5DD2A3|nr:helix-turn-helix domain-containing protein [Streptomyces sp. MST-110588]UNO42950.1 helix-turn-helix transcriptional regulator [Streptomyces sp. MST-110588]
MSGTTADIRPPGGTDAFVADCRARIGIDVLSHTWNAVVVFALRDGPRRPGELRTAIGGISAKVLTQTLRRLEGYGLVEHRRYAQAPPRVEYRLTAVGRGLLVPLKALGEWSWEYGDAVLAAQERADATARGRDGQP